MARELAGLKIRERRRALGLAQAELARRVGVSPSYLNLIERNKRSVAGKLLGALAAELGARISDLDGAAERRLQDRLHEVAADPVLAAERVDEDAMGELIGRFPSWARAIARLHRSYENAAGEAEAMADRLAHDPVLAERVHAMLTEISALRSTADILAEVPDIDPEQRARFTSNIAAQSGRLSETGAALAAYFDAASDGPRRGDPAGEAEDLLFAAPDATTDIENAAAAFRDRLGDPAEEAGEALQRWARRDGVAPEVAPFSGRAGRVDAMARAAAARALDALTGRIADDLARGRAPEVRAALSAILTRLGADAIRAPRAAFAQQAEATRLDLDALAAAHDGDWAFIARRVAAIGAPRAALVTVNAAGRTLARAGAPELTPPLREVECPLWALHRAAETPGRLMIQLIETPTGARRLLLARARPAPGDAPGRAPAAATDMLILDPAEARTTRYAAFAAGEQPEQVGPACRLCPRPACAHRAQASLLTG